MSLLISCDESCLDFTRALYHLYLQGSWLPSTGATTPGSEASNESGRSSRSGKSRIPRPISLPKRLEDKLSVRASRSPLRAVSAGQHSKSRPALKSPIKPVLPPRPKSRVRDTVKLFDAKSNKGLRKGPAQQQQQQQQQQAGVRLRRPVKPLSGSPKTGGGEGMVDFDSGGDPFR